MPDQVANPAPAAGGARPASSSSSLSGIVWTIARMFMMWFFIKNFFGQRKNLNTKPREELLMPKFQAGYPLDLHVYMTEQPNFSLRKHWDNPKYLVWQEENLSLGGLGERTFTYSFETSEVLKQNGSLWLHTYFHPAGSSIDPGSPDFDLNGTFSRVHPLIVYRPKPKVEVAQNLLGAGSGAPVPEEPPPKEWTGEELWISYFKPNITIALVAENSVHTVDAVPPHLAPYLTVDNQHHNYFPIVFFNEFWLLREHLLPVNKTVDRLDLHLTLADLSGWRFMMYHQMEESFSLQQKFGAMADGESDTFKRVLTEGNPYFLALTFSVSLLHSVFDMLAFKNDIGFWRGKKNVEGLSVRTILLNCACQVVVFLYLLDNETSFVILASSGVGLLIEFWKITRAMDVTLDRSGSFPRLRFKDKASYTDSRTKEYDAQAMKYLSWALYPLVAGYAIYALVYQSHKSWYSWIVNSLVGAVYTFGFLSMTPQLFLNYKLKSVAHLPWRQMSYKFLNTIIDDLFAFVIKMPMLHRLSVFRDDLVFLVYLYQRWIYRVDKRRANEFGYSEQAPAEEIAGASAAGVPAMAGTADAATPAADGAVVPPAELQQGAEGLVQRRQDKPVLRGSAATWPLPEGREAKKTT